MEGWKASGTLMPSVLQDVSAKSRVGRMIDLCIGHC